MSGRKELYPCDASRASCSRSRARTSSVKTYPFAQTRIRDCREASGTWGEAARPTGFPGRRLRSWRCCCGGLFDNGQRGGLDEHAIAGCTLEVAFALDAAIVLSRVIFELDADPFARGEMRVAHVAYDACAAVGQLHDLTDSYIGHVGFVIGWEGRV